MKNYVLTILFFFSFSLFTEPLLAKHTLYSDLQGRLAAGVNPDNIQPFYQPKHFYNLKILTSDEIKLQQDCAKKLVQTLTFIPDKIGALEKAVDLLEDAIKKNNDETMIMHFLCVTAIIYLNNLFECNIEDCKLLEFEKESLKQVLKAAGGAPSVDLIDNLNQTFEIHKTRLGLNTRKRLVERVEAALSSAPKGVMEDVKAQVVGFVKKYHDNAFQKEKWGKVVKKTPHEIWDRIDYWNREQIVEVPLEAFKPGEISNNTQIVRNWETKPEIDLNNIATYDWLRIFGEITAERLDCLPEFFHMEDDPKNGWGSNYSLHSFTDAKGNRWKTSEHYFQAHKFIEGSPTFLQIMNASTAGLAKKLASKSQHNWHGDAQMVVDTECPFDPGVYNEQLQDLTYKDCVMARGLYLKFSQNPVIKKSLIDTGSKALIENTSKAYPASYPDGHWGNDINDNVSNGRPKNMLGLMLAALRQHFIMTEKQGLQAFIRELSA